MGAARIRGRRGHIKGTQSAEEAYGGLLDLRPRSKPGPEVDQGSPTGAMALVGRLGRQHRRSLHPPSRAASGASRKGVPKNS